MSSLQPVSMLMSNLNVASEAKYTPNAMAAAQDTGQRQEIVQEGIRMVQTVQASEAAAEAQRVRRKNSDEQEEQGRRGRGGDSYEHSEGEAKAEEAALNVSAPIIEKKVSNRKGFNFVA